MKVLAVTQDFGFGPTSMLNRAIACLPVGAQVECWVPRHLGGLIDSRPNVSLRILPPTSILCEIKLSDFDAAIVACDYSLARIIRKEVPKVVVFDMLFWFWDKPPIASDEDFLVIAQNFLGVEKQSFGIRSVRIVGPLLPVESRVPFQDAERKGVIVNLGGFSSPCHGRRQASIYASIVYSSIERLTQEGFEVTVSGGDLVLARLAEMRPVGVSHLGIFSHSDFRSRLARASFFITTPGLGSIYEALFAGTHTYLLPPTNLTQSIQKNIAVMELKTISSFSNSALLPSGGTSAHQEAEFIARLFETYEKNMAGITEALAADITQAVLKPKHDRKSVADEAASFIEKMGGAGEGKAIEILAEFLRA